MLSYEEEQRSTEVRRAAWETIIKPYEERETVTKDQVAQLQIALTAITMPLASIGTCSTDGTPLRFIGGADGLRVCCTGNPQHCWKVGVP